MPDSSTLPLVLCEAEVAAVHRLSPTFVRVELTAPELADFGVDGPTLDQRIDEVSEKVKAKSVASLLDSYAI